MNLMSSPKRRLQQVAEVMRTSKAVWPIQCLIKHFCPEMEWRIHEAKGGQMLEAAE